MLKLWRKHPKRLRTHLLCLRVAMAKQGHSVRRTGEISLENRLSYRGKQSDEISPETMVFAQEISPYGRNDSKFQRGFSAAVQSVQGSHGRASLRAELTHLNITISRLIPCLRRSGYAQAGEASLGWLVRRNALSVATLWQAGVRI